MSLKFTFFTILFFLFFKANAQVPILNILPGSNHVVFLDFDGHTVVGTTWNSFNSGNPLYCTNSGFNNADIEYIFNMVKEDFIFFNVNITTDSTVFLAAPLQQKVRVVITNTSAWYPSAGGVANINSFTSLTNNVCFVFRNRIGGSKGNTGEATSHEVGHTLGLNHHSQYNYGLSPCTKTNEYQYQVGSGEVTWAPIMGVGYSANQTTWTNVASNSACTHTQTDLITITNTSNRGVALITDEHANTITGATPLNILANNFVDSGIITTNNDTDFFNIVISTPSYLNL